MEGTINEMAKEMAASQIKNIRHQVLLSGIKSVIAVSQSLDPNNVLGTVIKDMISDFETEQKS